MAQVSSSFDVIFQGFFALYKINLSTILLWIIRKTNISFIYFIKIHLQVLLTMEKADLCVAI